MQAQESAWRGDHTFNSGAAEFGLEHFLEPEVKQAHPDWTGEQVRSEATRQMNLRLVQDRDFTTKEAERNQALSTKWEVQMVGDRPQLVTRYGEGYISLETLWNHTQEYAKKSGVSDAFNEHERKMQMALQDALVSGKATSAAYALSHPDSIRYVQTWSRGEDGTFYSRQIDIGKSTGRDLKHSEVSGFITKIQREVGRESVQLEGISASTYVAIKGTISERNVLVTARAIVAKDTAPHSYRADFVRPELPPLGFQLPEILDRTPAKNLEITSLRAIRDPRFFDIPKNSTLPRPALPREHVPVVPSKEVLVTRPKVKSAKEELPVPKILEKVHREKITILKELGFIEKSGVAIAAVGVLLEKLSLAPPPQIKRIENSIRRKRKRKEKQMSVTRPKEKKEQVRAKVLLGVLIYERKRHGKNEFRKRRVAKSLRVEIRANKKKRETLVRLEKKRRLTKETPKRKRRLRLVTREIKTVREARIIVSLPKEKRLWKRKDALRKLTKKERKRVRIVIERVMKAITVRETPLKIKKEFVKKPEKIKPLKAEFVPPVIRMTIGIVLFLFLRRTDTKPQKNLSLPAGEAGLSLEMKRRELPRREETQWILLSILWYLAMLRESGRGSGKRQSLSPRGVIFVASHGMIKAQ